MDYRRVRTSEGVLDEVYFFACLGYVRNIWIYYAYYAFFPPHVSDNGGERIVDNFEKYFIRYKKCNNSCKKR